MPATNIFLRDKFNENIYHILKQVYKSIGSSSVPPVICKTLSKNIGCSETRIKNWWRKHRYVSKRSIVYAHTNHTNISQSDINKILIYINDNFDKLKLVDEIRNSKLNLEEECNKKIVESINEPINGQNIIIDPVILSQFPKYVSNDLNTIAMMNADTMKKFMSAMSSDFTLIRNICRGTCELCHLMSSSRLNKMNDIYACSTCTALVMRQYLILEL